MGTTAIPVNTVVGERRVLGRSSAELLAQPGIHGLQRACSTPRPNSRSLSDFSSGK